ncbi:MAG: hypothetical protein KJO17_09380 [Acidimicrobiia bacterium]|nr:hypothetical protein [Acidimicrobiia bacterium]MBT8217047.1 hypothetical protein [Acidimicrobiia bacterium]
MLVVVVAGTGAVVVVVVVGGTVDADDAVHAAVSTAMAAAEHTSPEGLMELCLSLMVSSSQLYVLLNDRQGVCWTTDKWPVE